MFKIAVNNLVQSIGDDVYIPSPSNAASRNLAPLALVERKASFLPFIRPNSYYTTDFQLNDIIEGEEAEVVMESDDQFCTFNRESTVKIEGLLKGYVKGIFDAGVKKVDFIKIKTALGKLGISEVNLPSLVAEISKRRLNMSHELVQEMSSTRRKALCIVTGVVKTTSPATISATLEGSVDGELKASHASLAFPDRVIGGSIHGSQEKDSERTLNLPAGTVLAFQVTELKVNHEGEVRVMVSHGSKGGFNKSKNC